jgi:hypothetical protein
MLRYYRSYPLLTGTRPRDSMVLIQYCYRMVTERTNRDPEGSNSGHYGFLGEIRGT